MYSYSIQLKTLLLSFRKTRISKGEDSLRSTYASDDGADNKSKASSARAWYTA